MALSAGCVRGPLSVLDPAGPASASVARAWWTMAAAAALILAVVMTLAAAAFFRRQVARERTPCRALIVAGGIVVPAILLAALLAYGLRAGQAMLPMANERAFRVDITAHQWWWEVSYPDAPGGPLYAANEIHIPAARMVHVRVRSADVIHSFWVPRLGGKIDAIPGRTNVIRLLADAPGEYRGACAEFCGTQHARMGMQVTAHAPTGLDRHLRALGAAGPPAGGNPAARTFAAHCQACHSLDPRQPGHGGPNLAGLRLRATLGAGAVAADHESLLRWLRDHQRIKPGNRMPATQLDAEALERVAAYVWGDR